MAQTLQYIININGNASAAAIAINNTMQKLNTNAEKTPSLFDKIGAKAMSLYSIFGVVENVANKVSGAIGKIVDVGSEAELQKLDMTTLMRGNEAAADALFKKIAKYGKDTVYDNGPLLDSIRTMMQYTIEGENAFSMLKKIGDVAMGDANKMQSLSLAFGQISSTGKVAGQDLNQMINAGFNPLSVISEKTGKSMTALKDEMSKGAISAEMVAQAFSWATEEG
ncbi:MAG: tape measure protein, partial [Muribaculaceae bacterium]|nr:tape measure protein [Muribaculaceae bacterium]